MDRRSTAEATREADTTWVQCDMCDKWRKIAHTVVPAAGVAWVCSHNADTQFADCEVAQQYTDEEIDRRIAMRNEMDYFELDEGQCGIHPAISQ